MFSNQRPFWKYVLCIILGNLATPALSYGESRSLEVQVLNRQSGSAIEGASVCVGIEADPDQFGAQRTNADGVVRFKDVPPNALLVTASKRGVQGTRQLLEPVSQSRVLVLKVATGGGGPECRAPAASADESGTRLTIDRISVSDAPRGSGDDAVVVSLEVSGKANQVRASEHPDFAGAEWQPYRSPLTLRASPGKGEKQLYVQVRQVVQAQGATIEVVSPVEQVRYRR